MSVSQLLEEAQKLLAQKAYRDAHARCLTVLQQDPKNHLAYYLLGILTADHANHAKAVELFDRALGFAPDHAPSHAQKARNLLTLNQREAALDAVKQASLIKDLTPFTLDTLGVVLSRAGRHEEAIPFYQKAVAGAPNQPEYFYNYGAALQFIGKMEEAREAYSKVIALDPLDARARAAMVTITKQTADENDIAELEALFPRFSQDANASLNIGHAIAKAYEDLQDGANALIWLEKAKVKKRQELNYDPSFDARVFEQACALAGDLPIAAPDAPGPIFIVGMPRTGTTLVDRILSSHSQVSPAGELTDFGLLLKQQVKSPGPFVLDGPTLAAGKSAPLEELGAAYIRRVRETVGIETPIFTDKMPLNVVYAPLILKAIPNARVICLLRHPADTVLSNYRQLFATSFSYYNYAYDLEATARYFTWFKHMVEQFENALPNTRFTTVRYESVVADIDTETRRLLDFCGLPFEQACIDFHTNRAPVATASSAQVRQPLYTSSLARWKRYRPGIDPALNILVEAGCMDATELID
ncbi:MAG: tetratricopeptide repeat-containing sulfotransferase family protein [Henriciella sp.]